jgi:DNA recombination protein RmuC
VDWPVRRSFANAPESGYKVAMNEILVDIGGVSVTVGAALVLCAALLMAVMLAVVIVVVRAAGAGGRDADRQAMRAEELEGRIAEMAQIQSETAGRLKTMGDVLAGRQAELGRIVNDRLDAMSGRIGQSMTDTANQTVERLQKLHERLAVIDTAQKNITDLSQQVTSLRDVLSNKQVRGAFGQARMEAIIRDGLPNDSYEFQLTLSNGTRPDCGVLLPDGRPLVIDAKFPLEAVTAFREAGSEDVRKQAAQRIRQDLSKHIADISEKYLIPGETQDTALMFVPAESVYADLHDGFDDIVQKAYRARVVIVSPSLLMLAIQVMQQIMKDEKMREAADAIRNEVGHLMGDIGRLRERTLKLDQHFKQASEDIRLILVSSEKAERRASNIENLDFDSGDKTAAENDTPLFTRKLGAAE